MAQRFPHSKIDPLRTPAYTCVIVGNLPRCAQGVRHGNGTARHFECGSHAHWKIYGRAFTAQRDRTGRESCCGDGETRGDRAGAGGRSHHGQRRAGGARPESRAAGGSARRPRFARRRHDHQQSVRLGSESRGTCRAGCGAGRVGDCGRGRHGVHVELPVPAEGRTHWLPLRQPGNFRFHDRRRIVGCVRELPHGDDR